MADLFAQLRQHPLFQDIDDEACHKIADCAGETGFHAGELILSEGAPAEALYLVRHGAVALEVHAAGRAPILIDTVGEGDVLGWSWMVPPFEWSLDARATSMVRAISIDAACLRKLCEDDHELGVKIYKRFIQLIARRMSAARLRLIDMYGNPQAAR